MSFWRAVFHPHYAASRAVLGFREWKLPFLSLPSGHRLTKPGFYVTFSVPLKNRLFTRGPRKRLVEPLASWFLCQLVCARHWEPGTGWPTSQPFRRPRSSGGEWHVNKQIQCSYLLGWRASRTPSRTMLPELLASHVVPGANSTPALPAAPRASPSCPRTQGWQVTFRLISVIAFIQTLVDSLILPFIFIGSISAGLLLFSLFSLVMDFYTPFQKTKQIVCLTSPGISGPGVGREAYLFFLWAGLPGYFQRDSWLTHLISFSPLY